MDYDEKELNKLVESIKDKGLLQPICVYVGDNNDYNILYGHRRFFACQKLGEKYIKCNILESKPNDDEIIFLQITENLHRENLSSEEFENSINYLKNERKMSVEEIATKISMSTVSIYKLLDAKKVRDEIGYIFKENNINLTSRDANKIKNATKEQVMEAVNAIVEHPGEKTARLEDLERINIKKNKKKHMDIKKLIPNDKDKLDIKLEFEISNYENKIQLKNIKCQCDKNLAILLEKKINEYYRIP